MVAKAIKPLIILAMAISALFVAPAVASAAPAGAVTAGEISTANAESAEAGINAIYTCRYSSLPPFQSAQFTCTVRFGSIQVIMNCQDGRQIFGPILQAVGTYNFGLSCAPTAFSTFSVREFS
ncbi:hypothetical protein DMH04_00330 [Kibdelosporangium aridum]|uniref:Uncharacterized protein n=2 Tax=Kibdelosporangium aridum TaxID=2030 RepID=A0A428ZTU6_KIBAR|nr:hypothetical protein DMH04_00330 [Kibdelosporangium aridum]